MGGALGGARVCWLELATSPCRGLAPGGGGGSVMLSGRCCCRCASRSGCASAALCKFAGSGREAPTECNRASLPAASKSNPDSFGSRFE